tara:strand:- start:106 stop:1290 length:1185 start_codon:yes stop_codon:yes gene_type:complete
MLNFYNKIIKEDGFHIIDSSQNEFIIGNPKKNPPIILKLHKKSLNFKLLLFPDLYFGEAYTDGSLEVKNGTLTDFLDIALRNIGREDTNIFNKIINSFRGSYRALTNFNFISKSKKNVAHHYDISEKLYDLFLDKNRQYSCAYFKNKNDSIDQAQINKINHIIKKLNLKKNQKVLDIGCGWGSLAIEIAKQSQCEVVGITLSENQLNYCKENAKKNNLENQVQFKLLDYREMKEKFDRVVSVGMFEHVGRKFYKRFFNKVSELLNENGLALIHTIGSINSPRDPHPWITKYIFPGGYTPSLSEVALPIEKSGLIISDLEVLRMHYAHTLRHWKDRFLGNRDKVLELFDEKFIRMWEFYLVGCEMAFKWGDQVVFQFQLTKNNSTTPITRDYIYQ